MDKGKVMINSDNGIIKWDGVGGEEIFKAAL